MIEPLSTRDTATQALRAEANDLDDSFLRDARKEILVDLPQFVKILKIEAKEAAESRDRIRAAREVCLLAGLYVEKHEHSGELKNINIYIPEADGGARGNGREVKP